MLVSIALLKHSYTQISLQFSVAFEVKLICLFLSLSTPDLTLSLRPQMTYALKKNHQNALYQMQQGAWETHYVFPRYQVTLSQRGNELTAGASYARRS